MPRNNRDEVAFRSEKRMRRMIEGTVENSQSYNQAQFIRQAIKNNVDYIYDKLKGQKTIRDFILDLNSDVEWLDIDVPEGSIEFKLDSNEELSVYKETSVEQEYIDKLDKCSRSSSFSRSSVIRACLIRELYTVRDCLDEPDKSFIKDRWVVVNAKIEKLNYKLVDSLYYEFQEQFIMTKARDEMEAKNMFRIEKRYENFKETDGYEFATTIDRGKQFIDRIEEALDEYNG